MPASPLTNFHRLAIHTMTLKPWTLRQCIDHFVNAGVPGITVWRNVLSGAGGAAEAGRMLADSGLKVVALVRGGFFVVEHDDQHEAALQDNRLAIEEAAAIGAPMVVLVCGAMPGVPLSDARKQIADGIAAVLPEARARGVKLAIEPLHPMYADTRSAVNTMTQARELCEQLGDDHVGIALDVYHTWWDDRLQDEIRRAADGGWLLAYHICDWRNPTRDLLNDRAVMGDGVIDLPTIRSWVEDAGFDGFNEVEIFSDELWAGDPKQYLERIKQAYLAAS